MCHCHSNFWVSGFVFDDVILSITIWLVSLVLVRKRRWSSLAILTVYKHCLHSDHVCQINLGVIREVARYSIRWKYVRILYDEWDMVCLAMVSTVVFVFDARCQVMVILVLVTLFDIFWVTRLSLSSFGSITGVASLSISRIGKWWIHILSSLKFQSICIPNNNKSSLWVVLY